ncbi:N-alpha-acetyltransferase 30 [Cichlidogyrus casuarinus]|uniref:N-alpha-acetyltransferase 30 n=1 Tax=Cichlidogyrus casuarinus TaxID=1844966 RepID=A0ABD2Q7X6_9PLAT
MHLNQTSVKPLGVDKRNKILYRRVSLLYDFGRIYDLSKECFDIGYTMTSFWQYVGYWPHLCLVATTFKGEIIGFLLGGAQINYGQPKIGVVNMLAVKEPYRNQGVGQKLMQLILHIMSAEFCVAVRLDTAEMNFAAQNVYERFGYFKEKLNNNFYSSRENGYSMILPLRANTKPLCDRIREEREQYDKDYPDIISYYSSSVADLLADGIKSN